MLYFHCSGGILDFSRHILTSADEKTPSILPLSPLPAAEDEKYETGIV